jgi:hypothetical protein
MANIDTILSGTFGILARRPGSVAIWTATYAVASLALGVAMVFAMTGTVGLTPDPMTNPAAFGGGAILIMVVSYIVFLLLGMVIMNAVFRAVLMPEEQGFASMRLGWDELRALGLLFLYLIGFTILVFIGELVVLLLVGLVGFAAGSPMAAGLLGILGFLALMGFLVWVQVRLSPLFPLSLYRQRISIDGAWALSRGRFWILFAAYLIVLVPLLVVGMALGWWYMGGYFAEIAAAQGDPALIQAAAQNFAAQQAAMGVPLRIFVTLVMALFTMIGATLWFGVAASATRALLDASSEVSETEVYRSAAIFE